MMRGRGEGGGERERERDREQYGRFHNVNDIIL